ncbi:hypothetical protein DXG01_008950 [Tephrocybe rancida]|nr:hypothetical protein DXG01_008950 [Tephrocybe rancida]
MAAASSSQLPSDSWDESNFISTSRLKAAVQVVPDDWDDDEDDDEPVTEQDNQRIWEDANAKAPNPMPTLIIAPSATSASHIVSPPQGAFQPTMRILKRPNSGANKSATPPPSSSAESLREREARYQAARERIFGSESGASTPSGEESPGVLPQPINFKDKRERTKSSTPPATVVRNPRGPTGNVETPTYRGFSGQRARPPSSSTPPHMKTEG